MPHVLINSVIISVLFIASQGALSTTAGCDPANKAALEQAALSGIERSAGIIHHTHTRPTSLFDLSCLDQYLNSLNGFNVLFDPGKIFNDFLDNLKNQICDHADKMWAKNTQKLKATRADQLFEDVPGVDIHRPSYELGTSPVETQVQAPPGDVELVLPRVLGKELPAPRLRELLQ